MRIIFRIICVLLLLVKIAASFGMPLIYGVTNAVAAPVDLTPPVTVNSPWMGTYRDAQSVALTCSDGSGSGCAASYYCRGADCKPEFAYNGLIEIYKSTTLRFYSQDKNGNSEALKSYEYIIDPALAYRFIWNIPQPDQAWYFSAPSGVAVDKSGDVYVADTANARIQKFDRFGNYITQWGTPGSGAGQFSDPGGVAVDSFGNVYVADTYNNRILKFDSNGTILSRWGATGNGDRQFSGPAGVALDKDNNVYVADTNNNRIQKFDSNGFYLTQWGAAGIGNGQLDRPNGVAVDSSSNVYVADTGNHRLQKFSLAVAGPAAPGGVSAVVGAVTGQATVSFTAPVSDGGSPILFYTVTSNPGSSNVTGSGTSLTVPGLVVGTPYTFTVTASNAAGAGPASAESNSVTLVPVNALCGSDSGTYQTTTPANLCGPGIPINFTGSGPWSWTCQGINGGNDSGCSALFDNTPPVTIPSPWMGNYRDAQSVSLSCADTKGSGCDTTYYCLGADCKPTALYKGLITVSSSTTLRFYSRDMTGNNEPVKNYEYTINPALAYRFEWDIPHPVQPWNFNYPSGVAVDAAGNVYMADRDNHHIQKFDSSGNYLTQWGSAGTGTGQFNTPNGVAVDAAGNVYVADSNNHRIQKFDSSGNYLTQWGVVGSGTGQFNYPNGVAVDSSSNVYVTDSNNNSLLKFDSSGNYLTQWGTAGNGSGQFNYPNGVAVDVDGNIYVADSNNNRIQKFNSSGTYLGQWGTYGSAAGQFSFPAGVALDAGGNFYVTDSSNSRIQKFDGSGRYLGQWGSQGSGTGQFYSPVGVAVAADGNVYVTESGNSRIQKFDNIGNYLGQWGAVKTGNGQFYNPLKVAVDAGGNVYVADTYNNRIQKFDSSGSYLSQWGTAGYGNGQFYQPTDVALDTGGNVYVVDTYNNFNYKIQKFDSNGGYLTRWYSPGGGSGQYAYPSGIAVDAVGNVYVADRSNHYIQKYDSNGNYLSQWGTFGSGNGQFKSPSGVALDTGGNVYVADTYNHRIQKFDSSGTYLSQWGTFGSGDGQFNRSSGVAVDADGNVYVADTNNHRIQKFDSSANYLTQLGTQGNGNGQFSSPYGVTVDAGGNVYVADNKNNRIQKFSLAVARPAVPTGVSAVAGFGQATVNFNKVGAVAGSPTLFYTVKAAPGNSSASGSDTPITIAGLTNGTPYTFTVTATNAAGVSPASAPSNVVIPGPVNAACGSDHGKTLTTTPTNLCNPGIPINISGTGPWNWTCQGSGGSDATCSAQLQMNTLTATISGNGSVNSGDGIACTASPQTGTCSKSYPHDTNVTLLAAVSNSLFSGWGGACTACGNALSCLVVLDIPKTCSATFTDQPLIVISGTGQSFTFLQSACAAAYNGAVIKSQAVTFNENLQLDNAGKTVTIKGGYDSTFNIQTGMTTVQGTLTINNGGIVVDRVAVK